MLLLSVWVRPSIIEIDNNRNAAQKFRGPSLQNLGRKNIKFWTTFSATSALDTEKVAWTNKNANVNLQCVVCTLQCDLFFVTFNPETAEILLPIVTHPMKIQHVPLLQCFLHKDQ